MHGLVMIAKCVHIPEARSGEYNRQQIANGHACKREREREIERMSARTNNVTNWIRVWINEQ